MSKRKYGWLPDIPDQRDFLYATIVAPLRQDDLLIIFMEYRRAVPEAPSITHPPATSLILPPPALPGDSRSRGLKVPKVLPPVVDLRKGCSTVEDQGELGSCTANALSGALEFLDLIDDNNYTDKSRLFI